MGQCFDNSVCKPAHFMNMLAFPSAASLWELPQDVLFAICSWLDPKTLVTFLRVRAFSLALGFDFKSFMQTSKSLRNVLHAEKQVWMDQIRGIVADHSLVSSSFSMNSMTLGDRPCEEREDRGDKLLGYI